MTNTPIKCTLIKTQDIVGLSRVTLLTKTIYKTDMGTVF